MKLWNIKEYKGRGFFNLYPMAIVGFSTGCFYRAGLSATQSVDFYGDLGAECVEISFATSRELKDAKESVLEIAGIVNEFDRVTFHAPFKEISYYSGRSFDAEDAVVIFNKLSEEIPNYGIVIHPNVVRDFDRLKHLGLNFLLENAGGRKSCWNLPEHFEKLKDYDFGYVLDLHHAYQMDSSMDTARRLRDVMGERLSQFHVSGSSPRGKHIPLHLAGNRKDIEKILKENYDVPIILEGEMDREETAREELEYVLGI